MSKQVEIQMGALAPSITQQLADQGVDIAPSRSEAWDNQADAITRLMFADILTPSQVEKARQRLMKHIGEMLK